MSEVVLAACFFLFLAVSAACARSDKENNVCPTFQDYATIKTNSKCWYNPDVKAKPAAIARRYGYNLENHKVITADGYILTLNRVVPISGNLGKSPILMHHGVCNNAGFWLLHGNTSSSLYLASLGYDVWLSNARGTELSLQHVNMTPAETDFWDFSFHEMAILDVPATLDYIKKKTGTKKISFIGHSMGGTIQFVYASMMPEHAKENVNAIIAMAPVVYTKHMSSEAAQLVAPYTDFFLKEFKKLNFAGTGLYPQFKRTSDKLCSSYPYITTCVKIVETISGKSDENVEPESMPIFFKRYPASFSWKSLAHFGQELHRGGRFQMYDYGTQENLVRYNSEIPLEYDVGKVNVPVYILYGEADLLSDEQDNLELFKNLKTKEKYIIPLRGANNSVKFTHEDFLFSKAMADLNSKLEEVLKQVKLHEQNQMDINKKN